MYQDRVKHPLSATLPDTDGDVDQAMWELFVAVGDFWQLGDKPEPYRQRLESFMSNRIALNPLYKDYYSKAAQLIAKLASEGTKLSAYETIFTSKDRTPPAGPPANELDLVQRNVANEFVAFRVALGGFLSFGALNYCGYFGGANIPGQPAPYRTFSR
jgi:hypothetical protein